PDPQVKYLILEDINKIMKNKELYLMEMRAECATSGHKKKVGTLEKFYETYYKQFINVTPVKTSSYPFHAPDLLTLNRVYLEFCLPDLIKKSSLPKLLFTGFPIYRKEAGKGIRIPHKVWSPDGKKLLFAGSPKKEYCPGFYIVDVKTGRVEKVYESPNFSEIFNPDLEWMDNGIVITCGRGIFINSTVLPGIPHDLLYRLELPDSVSNFRNGTISTDGKRLLFSGEKDGITHVFIYNFAEKKLIEEKLEDFDNDSLWAVWEEPGKKTIIKNGLDYQTHRKYEDLR
ncbi:MAG: hypothetical protein LWY06_14670, partial [Firmicutes bacterium]|nr:hypothetical protein [Bacillota bacterium]